MQYINPNIANWFEIPTTDIERAKAFYAQVTNSYFDDEEMPMPDGNLFKMAVFQFEEGAVSGMLVNGEGYVPTQTGSVVYLNATGRLDTFLARVSDAGGEVLVPKTPIEDGEKGHFAQFLDSEGNRVGFYALPA